MTEAELRAALERAAEALENLLSADPEMPTYQADYDAAEAELENINRLLGREPK